MEREDVSDGSGLVPHAGLGVLIRQRRQQLGLSMGRAAEIAGIGRTSLHRLEHGVPGMPVASKVAGVLRALGISMQEAAAVTDGNEQFLAELAVWMEKQEQVAAALADRPASGPSPSPAADVSAADALMLYSAQDGTVLLVRVGSAGGDVDGVLGRLGAAAAATGLLVSRPV